MLSNKKIMMVILLLILLLAGFFFILIYPSCGVYNNLIVNPGFEDDNINWDFRLGEGPNGQDVAFIDTSVVHSGLASVRVDPCTREGGGSCGSDRSIWQHKGISVREGKGYKLSGYVRHEDCASAPDAPCWVSPDSAGNLGPPPEDNNICWYDDWCDRGGARLGVDYYDSLGRPLEDETQRFIMVIADWTTANNQWHYVEITDIAPPGAAIANVWMQGHEHSAQASVWLDDVYFGEVGGQTRMCKQ